MKLGNAVDRITGDDCQMGHLDLSVIDDRHLRDLILIARILLLNLEQEPAVDLLDDLIDTRKQS